jgi:hypothetical protein
MTPLQAKLQKCKDSGVTNTAEAARICKCSHDYANHFFNGEYGKERVAKKKPELIRMKCLRTEPGEHYFMSEGPHNRVCPDCKKLSGWKTDFETPDMGWRP